MSPSSWTPFSLFETLLTHFEEAQKRARELATGEHELSLPLRLALIGFGQHAPRPIWASEHTAFINQYLETDYSPEALAWYENDAEAIASFACLSLGALLGLYQTEKIEDAELTLGEAQLPGFIMLRVDQIVSRFHPTS